MYLHANIRALRRKHKLTQKELAAHLDKAYITVGDYERGRSDPPLDILDKLCEVFSIDIATLIYHDIENRGLPDPATASAEVEQLRTQLLTQQRLTELQEQRLRTLEREIREQAPELAARLGLK